MAIRYRWLLVRRMFTLGGSSFLPELEREGLRDEVEGDRSGLLPHRGCWSYLIVRRRAGGSLFLASSDAVRGGSCRLSARGAFLHLGRDQSRFSFRDPFLPTSLAIGSGIWSSVSWDISSINFLLCRKASELRGWETLLHGD